MPRKVFTAGEVLAASDVNNFLMDQTVMVFAGTAARGSAIPSPSEGMYAHLSDTDELTYYDGTDWANRVPASSAGKILQIVSTCKTDTFTLSTTGLQDITGLAATITPSLDTSKVMAFLTIGCVDANAVETIGGDVTRNGTPVGVGDSAGNRIEGAWFRITAAANKPESVSWSFLDSPASTSALTYQARMRRPAGNVFINRSSTDSDTANNFRTVSTITLMEVAI
jgi:hypothetical protein